ncbi:ubiquitin-protein ligase E3A-like [Haliotis cracherodii]|uniref:ubiquitin-protein ligase E3A-like n=1 Tax=Haliotis cracherodii TaxID=6455 RepID=UPI0039EC5DD3
MNSKDKETSQGGIEAASVSDTQASTGASALPKSEDNMKRAAVRQLIEKYYTQLTDGCGKADCANKACASCPGFCYKHIDRNQLAVHAMKLCQEKADLCEQQPKKVAKFPVQETSQGTSSSKANKPDGDGASTSGHISSKSIASEAKIYTKIPEVKFLTLEKMKGVVDRCKAQSDWAELIRTIGEVFNNPESLLRSFRKTESKPEVEEKSAKVQGEGEGSLSNPVQETCGASAMATATAPLSVSDIHNEHTLDLDSLREMYSILMDIPDHPFQGALNHALLVLSNTVDMDLKYHHAYDRDPNYINIFIIVLEIPLLHSPEFIESAFPVFCRALGQLSVKGQAKLAQVWSTFGTDKLRETLQSLQQLITVKVIKEEGQWGRGYHLNDDEGILNATKVMKILFYASIYGGKRDSQELLDEEKKTNEADDSIQNEFLQGAVAHEPKEPYQQKEDPLGKELGVNVLDCREPLIPFEEFVNEPLNEHIDISTDYAYYKTDSDLKFSFVTHNFILTTASKYTSMYFDNRIRMLNERRTSFLHTIVHGGPPMPYLRIRVRRDHVIDDALVALEMVAMDNPGDLKKQLFVEFDGEQGLDEGGVSKEFFQLVVEELFNPDIGMFTYNESTHHFWFNPMSFENDGQFTLIGIVLGLAIYNSCILDIHFPMVVYRKLLGKKGTYDDLCDVDQTIASSLTQLLEYADEDIADVFMQTFRIGHSDVFGSILSHDLKENGNEIFVTQQNKQEFVDLYADFILNKSIERQFRAFKRGFLMVTNESPFRLLFRPEEVELLVCGSKDLDFFALEEATEYDGGFTKDSASVKNFWQVVHSLSEDQKKKLLQFTTGTDRVPVGGLSKLKLIIARNGPDSDRLPTSHTCFNVLLLPDYSSKDKLQERLLKAITHAKGFGML